MQIKEIETQDKNHRTQQSKISCLDLQLKRHLLKVTEIWGITVHSRRQYQHLWCGDCGIEEALVYVFDFLAETALILPLRAVLYVCQTQ